MTTRMCLERGLFHTLISNDKPRTTTSSLATMTIIPLDLPYAVFPIASGYPDLYRSLNQCPESFLVTINEGT